MLSNRFLGVTIASPFLYFCQRSLNESSSILQNANCPIQRPQAVFCPRFLHISKRHLQPYPILPRTRRNSPAILLPRTRRLSRLRSRPCSDQGWPFAEVITAWNLLTHSSRARSKTFKPSPPNTRSNRQHG